MLLQLCSRSYVIQLPIRSRFALSAKPMSSKLTIKASTVIVLPHQTPVTRVKIKVVWQGGSFRAIASVEKFLTPPIWAQTPHRKQCYLKTKITTNSVIFICFCYCEATKFCK